MEPPVEMMLELAIKELTDVRKSKVAERPKSKPVKPPDEWPYRQRVLVDAGANAVAAEPISSPWVYAFVRTSAILS